MRCQVCGQAEIALGHGLHRVLDEGVGVAVSAVVPKRVRDRRRRRIDAVHPVRREEQDISRPDGHRAVGGVCEGRAVYRAAGSLAGAEIVSLPTIKMREEGSSASTRHESHEATIHQNMIIITSNQGLIIRVRPWCGI